MAKQANITSDLYNDGKQAMLDKTTVSSEQSKELKREAQLVVQETETQTSRLAAASVAKGGRTLKQAAFAIGTGREVRLDELALAYNKQRGTRIGRNDIIRYLIDTLELEELLIVDLKEYKK